MESAPTSVALGWRCRRPRTATAATLTYRRANVVPLCVRKRTAWRKTKLYTGEMYTGSVYKVRIAMILRCIRRLAGTHPSRIPAQICIPGLCDTRAVDAGLLAPGAAGCPVDIPRWIANASRPSSGSQSLLDVEATRPPSTPTSRNRVRRTVRPVCGVAPFTSQDQAEHGAPPRCTSSMVDTIAGFSCVSHFLRTLEPSGTSTITASRSVPSRASRLCTQSRLIQCTKCHCCK